MGHVDDTGANWSFARRAGFLVMAVFLAAQAIPELLGAVPVLDELVTGASLALWSALMPVLGNALLGIDEPIAVGITGSGDMTWRWVQVLWTAVFSLGLGLTWAAIDRRRDYRTLHAWLRIVVRYDLALVMFSYGLAKLVELQFGPVSPIELTRTYGDSSPMGLAWTFMNYSRPYRCFGGLLELLGGLLLLSRRTTTLGALVIAGVMSNVVALNFCYDIAVKLGSSILLLMAVFLIAPELPRLRAFFLRNETVAGVDLTAPVLGPRMQVLRKIARVGFWALLATLTALYVYLSGVLRAEAPRPALYGLYEVEEFALDGAGRPPLITDAARWRRVFLGRDDRAMIEDMTGGRSFHALVYDATAETITLANDEGQAAELKVARLAPDRLRISGALPGGRVEATLQARDPEQFPLLQRRFHLINEVSFNR